MAKRIIFIILIVLVLIFVIQNAQVVQVTFLAWEVSLSRALVLLGTLLIGIIAGLLAGRPRRKEQKKAKA
jgi:uncharacterized integral membrane protein